MNRRRFFARTAGLFVAGIAARYLPKGPATRLRIWDTPRIHRVVDETISHYELYSGDAHGDYKLIGIAAHPIPKDSYGWIVTS